MGHETSKTRRIRRIRNKLKAVANGKPRLSVFKSNTHIYAQIIDDLDGKTLAAASTVDKELKKSVKNGGNVDAAKAVGTALAERAKKAKVEAIVFDRGSYPFHGRVKALANAAREAGLKF